MHSPSSDHFHRHSFSTTVELAEVRRKFSAWLAQHLESEERVGELSVVVSELGANAVDATPASAPAPSVEAWVEASGCTIEVVNHLDPAEAVDQSWDLHDPLRTGGRGLMLVAAFSEDVDVLAEDDRITVRCRTPLSAPVQ